MTEQRGFDIDEDSDPDPGLDAQLSTPSIRPGMEGYDAARTVWNASINRRPAFIVKCSGVADALHSLRFARSNGLTISVRGSGHNVTGCAVADGGLTIDLSSCKGVRVDTERRQARVGAGVTWGELDHETQMFGLATTGARVSSTGVAGVTLGGGYGWLMRKHGLAIDNLRSVDLITANGDYLQVDEHSHPDLFWGLRGGGGNFGIVTSLQFDLHQVGPVITAGALMYPAARAPELLDFYREFMAGAPDELLTLFNLRSSPPPAPFVPTELRSVPVAVIVVCHIGTPEQARADLTPLKALGVPLLDRVQQMPYTALQRLFDVAGQYGLHVYPKSGHLPRLTDQAITTLAHYGQSIASPLSILMVSARGGAVARVREHDTAFSHRDTLFDYSVNAVWADPACAQENIAWADDTAAALKPLTVGVYVNELGDQGIGAVRDAYNPVTYARLRRLKQRYDPKNIFCMNHNIPPIGMAVRQPSEGWQPGQQAYARQSHPKELPCPTSPSPRNEQ